MAAPAAAGLFGGTDAPRRIPVPAREFSAQIEDTSGVRVPLTRVSFDGEVFVFGTLGKAQVTVAFEDIDEVRFQPTDDADWFTGIVKTRAGDEVRVLVEYDRPLFGRTSFGNYRIEVADVRVLDL